MSDDIHKMDLTYAVNREDITADSILENCERFRELMAAHAEARDPLADYRIWRFEGLQITPPEQDFIDEGIRIRAFSSVIYPLQMPKYLIRSTAWCDDPVELPPRRIPGAVAVLVIVGIALCVFAWAIW